MDVGTEVVHQHTTAGTVNLLASSLYVSHFLSTWNSRGFEFGAVLFLTTMYPATLLQMSLYALLRSLAAIIFSPNIGSYIDTNYRLHVVRISILGQRFAVILSCGLFWLALQSSYTSRSMSWLLLGSLIILACAEKLFSIMNIVAVERDWVVVIAAGDGDLLQKINNQMRRIDLACKLFSPLAIALLHSWSVMWAIWTTVIVNAASAVLEYVLIARVFRKVPLLSQTKDAFGSSHRYELGGGASTMVDEQTSPSRMPSRTCLTLNTRPLLTYVEQSAFLPSLALSVLYLTVLSFAGQMTAFLLAIQEPKITSGMVGMLRTASTLLEVSSTFAAPRLMSKIGPVRAGMWFLLWQAIFLSPAVCLLWYSFSHFPQAAISVFIAAVTISRLGLWSFDLCAQVIIQESISASQRGLFSTVEASIQNFFELCAFAMTIIFPKPEQFRYPALVSLLAVYCSAALYARFVRNRRGHLLHMPACLKPHEVNDRSRYEHIAHYEVEHVGD